MMRPGWTVPDLIKDFVSAQSTLHPTEIGRFRLARAFPEEKTAKQNRREGRTLNIPRFNASDLYEPLDVFRNLGLPIIDWRGKDGKHRWNPNTKGGTPVIF